MRKSRKCYEMFSNEEPIGLAILTRLYYNVSTIGLVCLYEAWLGVSLTSNIINLSDTEDLVTLMTCNEIFDPNKPDTFGEMV